MDFNIRNELVVGAERYNKTKVLIYEQNEVWKSEQDLFHITETNNNYKNSEKGIHEFEDSLRSIISYVSK